MTSIPDLAAEVISVLAENEEAVWAWASARVYAELVAANPDDLLVRVGQRFSFEAIVAACQDYRRYAGGRGVEATHEIAQLCRALVVKALRGWSYRQTCAELRTNSLVRWFVGYGLHEPTLSYVTLQRFGVWVDAHHPRLFFNEILRQIDADFPSEPTAEQVGDTFALLADVAAQSRTEMLRDAGQRLLRLWEQLSPDQPLPGWTSPLSEALLGPAAERPEYRLEKAEREAREVHTALAAHRLLTLLVGALALLAPVRSLHRLALERWLGILHKILHDEFVFTYDESGAVVGARHAEKKERGSFVLGSTVDPEATFRKHGARSDLGYNVHVAATEFFVREIFATTGAMPDASGVAALVAHQHEQLGLVPPKLIYDRAAGSAKTFYAVAQASDGQTQLVAALIDHAKNQERFGPLDFTLHADGSLECPAGQTTTKAYRAGSGDGYNYRFTAQQCVGCPLWEACRGPRPAQPEQSPPAESPSAPAAESTGQAPGPQKRAGPAPTSSRQVFLSAYRSLQREAILYTQTDAFRQDMKKRPAIERIIAALVRYNDARRARSTGLVRADSHVRWAALAFNLKRWRVLILERERAQRFRPSAPA